MHTHTHIYICVCIYMYTYKYTYIHTYIDEGGNGNPLQYSCLENSMDKGAYSPLRATVHEVANS